MDFRLRGSVSVAEPPWRKLVERLWADYVLTVGSLVFAAGMTTTLLDSHAVVPITTSSATAACLAMFSIVQWSAFKAKFGAASNAVVSVLWALVALLRHG